MSDPAVRRACGVTTGAVGKAVEAENRPRLPRNPRAKMGVDDQGNPGTDFDTWQASFRAHFPGEYSLTRNRNDLFAGSVRMRCVGGLPAVELRSGNHCFERTLRDIRRDEADHLLFAVSVSGRATWSQNDQAMKFAVGDCMLINAGRPFSYAVSEQQVFQSVALLMPRRLLTSTIGFEPRGAVSWNSDTLAVRLLSRLILDAHDSDPGSTAAEYHMQMAICDLLGSLTAANDLLTDSSHKEKTFARIRDIVRGHFTDPEFGPREIASEAGISLRYLQKFFTARGTTCSRFIQSLRLEYAARLVRRRNLTRSGQPLADIAHLSGFQEYSHFARIFRHRFGHSPGAKAALDQNSTPPIGSPRIAPNMSASGTPQPSGQK
jgi:AraC-like DNA-binding protein